MDLTSLMARVYSIREMAALLATQAESLDRDLRDADEQTGKTNSSIGQAAASVMRATGGLSRSVGLLDDAYTDLNIEVAVSALSDDASDDVYHATIAAAIKVRPGQRIAA